jgi:hypothetical protein
VESRLAPSGLLPWTTIILGCDHGMRLPRLGLHALTVVSQKSAQASLMQADTTRRDETRRSSIVACARWRDADLFPRVRRCLLGRRGRPLAHDVPTSECQQTTTSHLLELISHLLAPLQGYDDEVCSPFDAAGNGIVDTTHACDAQCVHCHEY